MAVDLCRSFGMSQDMFLRSALLMMDVNGLYVLLLKAFRFGNVSTNLVVREFTFGSSAEFCSEDMKIVSNKILDSP